MRPLSDVERLWLAAERVAPPFVLNLVIEGTGEVSIEALRSAVQATLGASSRLQGHLGWARWVDGPPPPVRALPSEEWSGLSPGPAWLTAPLPVRSQPAEVLTGAGRIVFRAHHALMDGRGLLTWAQGVFARLNHTESCTVPSLLTDRDIAATAPAEPAIRETAGSPLQALSTPSLHTTWRRIHIPGTASRLVPRLVQAVAAAVHDGEARIDVPVDLRPLHNDVHSTANLTGIVRLLPGTTVEQTHTLLQSAVQARSALGFVTGARWLRWWPVGVLGWLGRRGALKCQAEGRYIASATVSTLGKLDRSAFSCGDFTAQRIAIIPPGQPGLPLLLTATGTDLGVDLCAAAPSALAGETQLDELLDELASFLSD